MAPRTPLIRPRQYFHQMNHPSLARGGVIVLLQALLLVVVAWLFVNQVLNRVGRRLGEFPEAQTQLNAQLFAYFVMTIVGWILLAALLHFFMWFGDAEQGFGTTLAVVGEAEIVGLVFAPAVAFVMLSAVGQAPTELEALSEFIQSHLAQQSQTLLMMGFVTTLWKAVISGYGLSVAHDISTKRTMVLTFGVGIVVYYASLAA